MQTLTAQLPYRYSARFNGSCVQSGLGAGLLLLALAAAMPSLAAPIVWNGASGTDTNWSTPGNWVGGNPPASTDGAVFTNNAPVGNATTINNVVDSTGGAFGGTLSFLQYSQTNNNTFHNTLIASGVTLAITNNTGPFSTALYVGTLADPGFALTMGATISGTNGAVLAISNTAANILIAQGGASTGTAERGTLDMSGLDTFKASVSRIGVAGRQTFGGGSGPPDDGCGVWYLAKTNVILVNYVPTTAYAYFFSTNTSSITSYPLVVGDTSNAGKAGFNYLYLGITNFILADGLAFGTYKSGSSGASGGSMLFNPAFASQNPVAVFRNTNGTGRITYWAIGDQNGQGGSNQDTGTNDFSGGTVDILVNALSLGKDANNEGSGQLQRGILTFASGIINANTVTLGNQIAGIAGSNQGLSVGILNVTGANATLVVNTNLELGHTTLGITGNVGGTAGLLNIRNGKVLANNITVGNVSITNLITMTNGTLVLSNALASTARALNTFATTNSTLQLTVTTSGSPIVALTNLVTGGTTNFIKTPTVPVFSSYPAQVPLIKYFAAAITGVGCNFGLDSASLPASAPGAYLSNNVANHSIDLVLPNDPRPVIITSGGPFGYNGVPGDNVTTNFVVSVSPFSVTPVSYQWYDGASPLTDGVTASTSIIAGSTTAHMLMTNAQSADSGNYTCVASNLYGMATSVVAVLSISAGDQAPTIVAIAPGNSQTVIQGHNASFILSTSGSPAPDYYWFDNNNSLIAPATTATLALNNVQYSQLGTYSVIVSNRAGTATTNMFLDVIVTPAISAQPQPLLVTNGNSASFAVTASGVPAPDYYWLKNGNPITGNASAHTATLTLAAASSADIANYSVIVSNSAGQVTSTNAPLVVNSSTLTVAALAPTNGAVAICYDTPLYITFNQPPLLRKAGQIRIYNATNTVTPVDTLDLSQNVDNNATYAVNVQTRLIGGDSIYSYPVIITGNTAAMYPHTGVMTSNQTYYVTIDDGVFTDPTGAYFAGIADTNAWRFATKPTGPANPTSLVVAADGSGDFLTVQGAIDYVPSGSTTPRLINVRNGTYTELINIKTKNNLVFRGQSRTGSVVTYPNNNYVNSSGAPWRAMFIVNANDCAVENLTITNSTPKGGSQAEAIDIEGTRFVLYNMELDSFQDTFLSHNAGKLLYLQDCLIQGDTDFNWGYGTVFYTNCELRMLTTGGHVTQPRSPASSNGMSFVNCRLTKGSGSVTSADLGRSIGTPSTPSEVIFVTCLMDDIFTGYNADAGANFWYSSCSNLTATVEKTSLANATRLLSSDPIVLSAQSAPSWLYGWQPQMAPNLLTNPAGQSVAGGAAVMLTSYATGIPQPSYQWLKNGAPISGQTGATLFIASVSANDVATYSVVVSNIAGVVTSSGAALAVGNTAPALSPLSDQMVNVGVTVTFNAVATDPDRPVQSLTFSLTAGPANAAIDSNTGAFSFRPLVSQAGATYPITVTVTDNGSPNLSASQSFNVTVNPLTQPSVGSAGIVGGQATFSVAGETGPDYAVQASTNLVNWETVFTTNSPAMPFQWSDPNSGAFAMRFYRIVTGPPLP